MTLDNPKFSERPNRFGRTPNLKNTSFWRNFWGRIGDNLSSLQCHKELWNYAENLWLTYWSVKFEAYLAKIRTWLPNSFGQYVLPYSKSISTEILSFLKYYHLFSVSIFNTFLSSYDTVALLFNDFTKEMFHHIHSWTLK